MQERLKKMFVVLMIFSLLFSVNTFVLADDENNNENETSAENNEQPTEEKTEAEIQMEELEGQKSNLENAISFNEAQIGVVEGQLSETLEEIETLSTKIEQKKNEILILELEEKTLISFIDEKEKQLEKYSKEYKRTKQLLDKRLVVMYEMGETTYLDLLLKSKGISDFLSRYYLLSEIGEADYNLVSEVKKNKDQTEKITKSLSEQKEKLEKDKEDREKYKISLANMEILKINKVNALNEDELSLYKEIEEYRNEIANIESELKQLALQNLGKTYIGGTMVWPAPGYSTITSPFGLRTHPITGIYKLHTGTDIGAPYGANFVAANDGVVIKATYNAAYGNMVMLDHGGGVVTLYAHGSEICVSEGETVKAGQNVLKVGSTGYSTGPHAHFEIRINGEYLNPLDYVSPTNNNQVHEEENEVITVELNP